MRRSMTRASAAIAAFAAVIALGAGGVGAAGATIRGSLAARAPSLGAARWLAAPGTRLWVTRYNGPGNRADGATSVAVSPGGSKVFVTGYSHGRTSGDDYATVAYSASTGARLWVKRYNGPGNGTDRAASVAVSPSGTTVFVTGSSVGAVSGQDYATVAYSAATGAQLWVRRLNGHAKKSDDGAASITVSPNGRTVFVTGSGDATEVVGGPPEGQNYLTVAYRAATGTVLWVKRYNGPGNGSDFASSVAVSPTGQTVYVNGSSVGAVSHSDYATIAYNAATGAQRWVRRYNGPGNGDDLGGQVVVSHTGRTVFVTGTSLGARSFYDYATIAYNAATGARLWVKRYNGPGNDLDTAGSLAVSPTGRTVFVTGSSFGTTPQLDYATIAYNAATGTQLWVQRYNGPGHGTDRAGPVAVSPDGHTVFVTGSSWGGKATGNDYATIAYNAVTGGQLWVQRYNGPGNGTDGAASMALSPGGQVFVTGQSTGKTSGLDYATIAYQG